MDVGVVPLGLGEVAHAVDEGEGALEVGEDEHLRQMVLVRRAPAVELREQALQRLAREAWHATFTGDAVLAVKRAVGHGEGLRGATVAPGLK
jgi:hypothetical protein